MPSALLFCARIEGKSLCKKARTVILQEMNMFVIIITNMFIFNERTI